MKYLNTLLIFLMAMGWAYARDSTKIKILNSGIFIEGEMLGSQLFKSDYGHGFRIGGYVERQLLERVRMKIQIGLRNKEFNRPIHAWEDLENSDTTAILDRYRQYRSSLRITGGFGFNFYYIQKTNFKLFMGLAFLPEYVLSNKVNSEYITSTYRGSDQFMDAPRTNIRAPGWKPFRYDRFYEFGLGIAFKRMSLELLLRTRGKNEYSHNFGIRIAGNIFDNIK